MIQMPFGRVSHRRSVKTGIDVGDIRMAGWVPRCPWITIVEFLQGVHNDCFVPS